MSDKELEAGYKEHELRSPANGFLASKVASFSCQMSWESNNRGVFTFFAYAMIIKTQHARRTAKYK